MWTIPARRYKTGHDLVLPLSGAAKAVLADVPRIGKSPFVFSYSGARPIAGAPMISKNEGVTDCTCRTSGSPAPVSVV